MRYASQFTYSRVYELGRNLGSIKAHSDLRFWSRRIGWVNRWKISRPRLYISHSASMDMTVQVTVIGHEMREAILEGFEDEHTLQDLRDYWEEHFVHIDWTKNTVEDDKSVEIGKQEAVPWADVAERTLGELNLEVHETLTLKVSHTVG